MDQFYETDVTVVEGGIVHGILLHWTLFLLSPAVDPSRQHCYSSFPDKQNWQDHWKPCVYPLPDAIAVDSGDIVTIRTSFNADKVTASISKIIKPDYGRKRSSSGTSRGLFSIAATAAEVVETDCTCGWHLLCGGERFQMMCDPYRAACWQLALDQMIAELRTLLDSDGPTEIDPLPGPCLVLDASDGSLLSISTAVKLNRGTTPEIGVDKLLIVSKESKLFSRMFSSNCVSRTMWMIACCYGTGSTSAM